MFRFSIRDVLWLMVVVGLAVALATAFGKHRNETQIHQREKADLESRLVDAALAWAKERGGSVDVAGPGCTIRATPEGRVSILDNP